MYVNLEYSMAEFQVQKSRFFFDTCFLLLFPCDLFYTKKRERANYIQSYNCAQLTYTCTCKSTEKKSFHLVTSIYVGIPVFS